MKKWLHTLWLLTAAGLLPLLTTACSDSGADEPDDTTRQFINLTISVTMPPAQTASATGPTRANPAGGADGDGREAGFERENAVSGVTLILADGPLSDATARIAFAKYFSVRRLEDPSTAGTSLASNAPEARYTTGNQPLSRSELDMSRDVTYHAFVVANQSVSTQKGDLLADALADATTTLQTLWNGTGYQPNDSYSGFAMASASNLTLNFTNTTDDVSVTEGLNVVTYDVRKPIVIERLAARIDFCTNYNNDSQTAAYNTYNVTDTEGTATTVSGFKYITGADGSYYVLESITPFNLFNEREFLFKRVTTGWTGEPVTTYLGAETTTNYVADPSTALKTTTTTLGYINGIAAADEPTWGDKPYYRTAQSMAQQPASAKLALNSHLDGADKSNVFVVAYAMENTLLPNSPLKPYATGLCITGSYYTADHLMVGRKTIYGYLRHQGEAEGSYKAFTWENLDAAQTVGSKPMNFGVVRNNIYRVSIDRINSTSGDVELRLAVHDWREVNHPDIYI